MTETAKVPTIATAIDGNVLTLTFSHGKTIIVNPFELPEEMQRQLIMHGLKQKLVDAAAIPRNVDTGMAATVDEKYQAVSSVADRLRENEWNAKRSEGSGSGGILALALHRYYKGRMTNEEIATRMKLLSKAELEALKKQPDIQRIIGEIRAENAKPSDPDLLSRLFGDFGGAQIADVNASDTNLGDSDEMPTEPTTPKKGERAKK